MSVEATICQLKLWFQADLLMNNQMQADFHVKCSDKGALKRGHYFNTLAIKMWSFDTIKKVSVRKGNIAKHFFLNVK
jgi:hypothetical protein